MPRFFCNSNAGRLEIADIFQLEFTEAKKNRSYDLTDYAGKIDALRD